jgi:membrane-associated HD superfamily phosphohydrolase
MTRPAYKGEQLTHASLARRREEVQSRHKRAVEQVGEFYTNQAEIADELGKGLQRMKGHGQELDRVVEEENASGIFATLMRPFTARRVALARKSVAEALLAQYETVSVRLREATAFSDDLKLCALEMQDEVDRLHRDHAAAKHNEKLAAERVLEVEKELAQLEQEAPSPERARRIDQLTFDLRTEAIALDLFRASAEQCAQHLEPARTLRDTVLELHEDMAKYVLSATQTVNAAGRRIQGLGMMADAPVVVSELQASIDELNTAMEATAEYVEQSRHMISEVLPELSRKLEKEAAMDAAETADSLEAVSRERSRKLAERALREAAAAEIDDLLGHLD